MTEFGPRPARIEREASDGIAIRELIEADALPYFELIDQDRPHMSQTHNGVFDETAEKYETLEAVVESIRNPKPRRYRFGIWDTGTMVGSNNIQLLGGGRGEIGSWIGGAYTGHNYAARGRKLLLEVAFEDLGLDQVISKVLKDNTASRISVERSGLTLAKEEGVYCIYTIDNTSYR